MFNTKKVINKILGDKSSKDSTYKEDISKLKPYHFVSLKHDSTVLRDKDKYCSHSDLFFDSKNQEYYCPECGRRFKNPKQISEW